MVLAVVANLYSQTKERTGLSLFIVPSNASTGDVGNRHYAEHMQRWVLTQHRVKLPNARRVSDNAIPWNYW